MLRRAIPLLSALGFGHGRGLFHLVWQPAVPADFKPISPVSAADRVLVRVVQNPVDADLVMRVYREKEEKEKRAWQAEAEVARVKLESQLLQANAAVLLHRGLLNMRGLLELAEERWTVKPKKDREAAWADILEKHSDLTKCIMASTKWPIKAVPKRVAHLYAHLSGFIHWKPADSMAVAIVEGSVNREQVHFLVCLAKALYVPYEVYYAPTPSISVGSTTAGGSPPAAGAGSSALTADAGGSALAADADGTTVGADGGGSATAGDAGGLAAVADGSGAGDSAVAGGTGGLAVARDASRSSSYGGLAPAADAGGSASAARSAGRAA